MAQNRHGDIEKMDCAKALVGKQILLFFLVLLTMQLLLKNKGVATAKL
jgi:hypothetical protein